jgi:multicomponent Na+:H+ antiporter subunit A
MSMTTTESTSNSRIWLAVALLPFSAFAALAWRLLEEPLPWQFSLTWVPSLDIALRFRIDGLGAQMLALITGIGTLVFVYAVGYLSHEPRRGQIFLVLPLFMLAMMGAVSADNVIVLFTFWELTSITSFLLVGFKHQDPSARDSARQALLITMGGGLALLGGLILLSQMAGNWTLSGIIAAAPELVDDPLLPWAIVLVLLGAFTKSAQFPFHFWLPNAMSAPTPISAYLHSATMVKLGIYLMARLDAAFNDLLLWEVILVGTGTLTALWAASLALCERDLKRILARSTVSALGTLTVLVGLPSPGAGLAVIAFMVAHALYKAPLFMVAGNIDHATGTRVIDRLTGLRRVMPGNAATAILAGLSMAGLPLTFGFVAKDLIGLAKAEAEVFLLVSYVFVLVNALAAAAAGVAAIRVFWGPLKVPKSKVHEVSRIMLLPPLVIALLGLELVLFPHVADPLLLPAANAISPGLDAVELGASYSLGELLVGAGITLGTGLILFIAWDRLHNALGRMTWLHRRGPEAGYGLLLAGLARVAAWHTRLLQPGRLDGYLRLTLGALLLIAGFAAWQSVPGPGLNWQRSWHWPPHAWAWLVASLLMVAGAASAVFMRDRLAALMASGVVGYGAAVLFLFAGAPDLAFTQFSVETALVIVAAAVLRGFPRAPSRDPLLRSPLSIILAAAAGVGTLLLLLHLQGLPENRELADWLGANSLSGANGHNVVNVILVDFRALDTFGEIAVVAFALLAALPLLSVTRRRAWPASPLMELSAVPLYWLLLAGSLWILLRGHNEPGGGFIGGLVAVAASSLLAILREPALARRYQPLPPLALALAGIALALLGGLMGALWGPGFLRHLWWGGLSTAMLFDLGVFCVVWGTLTGYIYALLGETDRHRARFRSPAALREDTS